MAVSEQARLVTVEDHVRGENARDLDLIMGTFSDSDNAAVVYNGIPTTGHRKIRRSYDVRLNALPDFRFEVKQRHFQRGRSDCGTFAVLHEQAGAAGRSADVHYLLLQ
jgi:hypothetical protein